MCPFVRSSSVDMQQNRKGVCIAFGTKLKPQSMQSMWRARVVAPVFYYMVFTDPPDASVKSLCKMDSAFSQLNADWWKH